MWLGSVETGTTYLENARLKAWAGLRMLDAPVLAEDTGLEIDALRGAPGLMSARYAGPSEKAADNVAKVLRLLSGLVDEGRADRQALSARYRIVAVMAFPSGREVIGEGVLEGRITLDAAGSQGFGYDPIFIPNDADQTLAELEIDAKNRISHRTQAVKAVLSAL